MARIQFIGWSQAELEAELKAAEAELITGKSTISANLGEASYSKIMTVGPYARINLITAALNRLDPVRYPINDVSVPTRTVATYNGPR